jgi:VanZ family protein
LTARRWAAPALWAAVILTLTTVPSVPAPPVAGADKAAHLLLYGAFAALSLRAAWSGGPSVRRLLAVALAIAVFGALDEWHQLYIPGRSADVRDWFADVTGMMLGLIVMASLLLRRIPRNPSA